MHPATIAAPSNGRVEWDAKRKIYFCFPLSSPRFTHPLSSSGGFSNLYKAILLLQTYILQCNAFIHQSQCARSSRHLEHPGPGAELCLRLQRFRRPCLGMRMAFNRPSITLIKYFVYQREAIVSTFTQDTGALAAVNADWLISTDLQVQPTGTANIQYVAANVFQHQDALGLKASAVSASNVWLRF